jgi:transposase
VSCLSWKWRERSSVKIAERTYELCEELGLRPTVFYRWQKELFENGAAAFQSQERPRREVEEKQKRIEFLEKKVQTKDEVLAELMAEHIALKKSLGVAAMLAGSLAGESPAGGSLPSYPRSDIRRRRG